MWVIEQPLTGAVLAELDEPSYIGSLRALDRKALCRLWDLLEGDSAEERDQLVSDLMVEPHSLGTDVLGELVAICDTDRIARLGILRGIRDALGGDV